jgi:methyl coenzyme M reductase gamma subunit
MLPPEGGGLALGATFSCSPEDYANRCGQEGPRRHHSNKRSGIEKMRDIPSSGLVQNSAARGRGNNAPPSHAHLRIMATDVDRREQCVITPIRDQV